MIDELELCKVCPFYDRENDNCGAFSCDGLDCDTPLPCEEEEEDDLK